jgi:hypothetical protein
VKIPRPDSLEEQSDTPMADKPPQTDIIPSGPADHPPAQPGVGQLKSLGE